MIKLKNLRRRYIPEQLIAESNCGILWEKAVPISKEALARMKKLVKDVEVDLDKPLNPEDE